MPPNSNNDVAVAAFWAVAMLATVTLTNSVPVRLVLAIPLVLFVTGHMVLRALDFRAASMAAHCTYAVGASIGVCLVGGLALDSVGWLTPAGWAVWFASTTVALSWFTYRSRADRPLAFQLPRLSRLNFAHRAAFGVALLVSCSAYAIAVHGEASQHQFRYTEFWMVPASRGAPDHLLIGIKSAEPTPQVFDVDVTLDGRTAGLWRSVEVQPGSTWLVALDVAPGRGKFHKAKASLYRAGTNEIYRRASAVLSGG